MKQKYKIITNCIVILVAAIFLVLPFVEGKEKEEYDIVFLGDSIIGNEGNYSVVELVGEILGKKVYNGAFGGSSLSINSEHKWGSFVDNRWCMARLAEAIVYDDWQGQLATMSYAESYKETNLQQLSYFDARMDGLSDIDFQNVDILVIEHGTNDYNAGKELDNPENSYDIDTFGGALRNSLRLLKEKYPEMQIVLVTPLYCEFGDELDKPCYSTDLGNGTLDVYVELEQEIAKEFGVICIDAYHESGIWEENAKEYLSDGLHLSDKGVFLISEFLAKELEKILQ